MVKESPKTWLGLDIHELPHLTSVCLCTRVCSLNLLDSWGGSGASEEHQRSLGGLGRLHSCPSSEQPLPSQVSFPQGWPFPTPWMWRSRMRLLSVWGPDLNGWVKLLLASDFLTSSSVCQRRVKSGKEESVSQESTVGMSTQQNHGPLREKMGLWFWGLF